MIRYEIGQITEPDGPVEWLRADEEAYDNAYNAGSPWFYVDTPHPRRVLKARRAPGGLRPNPETVRTQAGEIQARPGPWGRAAAKVFQDRFPFGLDWATANETERCWATYFPEPA